MANWRDQVGDRLVNAETVAGLVSSGQTIHFTMGREGHAVGMAIAARMGELENVKLMVYTPTYDFGWYDEGWQDAFETRIFMPSAACQEGIDGRRVDINTGYLFNYTRPLLWLEEPDMLVTEISTPDERGLASFGQSLWNKRRQIAAAKEKGIPIVAEVNESLIRTYGDNFVDAGVFDYFVEHIPSGAKPAMGTLAGRARKEVEPYLKQIAGYVAELIKDGDTIQIGVGRTTEPLVRLGIFDQRNDLGYHSEATPSGIIDLVRRGVINGRLKSVHNGKVIITSLGGGTKQEMEWAHDNPIFELKDSDYVDDIRAIASNDNMVALNNVLAIDLTGQVTGEQLGHRILSQAGGQGPFTIGALLSKGGRAIQVLPSTALGGKVSRIMPDLPLGSAVTVPRYCMDHVVTEYGVARLWGKSLRQRAEALIEIAHPDFRDELRAEARSRLWP